MPAFITNEDAIEVTTRLLIQGELCYSTLTYVSQTEDQFPLRAEVMKTWVEDVIPLFQAVTTEDTQFLDVRVRSRGFQAGLELLQTLNVFGDVVSDTLPVWVNWTWRLTPDNANKYERPGATWVTDFKYGRFNLAGVPESMQENGLASSSALSALNAISAALNPITPSAAGTPLTDDCYIVLARDLVGATPPFQQRANLLSVDYARLGSQLTRKH